MPRKTWYLIELVCVAVFQESIVGMVGFCRYGGRGVHGNHADGAVYRGSVFCATTSLVDQVHSALRAFLHHWSDCTGGCCA